MQQECVEINLKENHSNWEESNQDFSWISGKFYSKASKDNKRYDD